MASFTNGLSGSAAMAFADTYNSADELSQLNGPESPGSGSDTLNLFSNSSYTPAQAIASALIGTGISLTRSYNDRLLPTGETDTVGTTSGTANLGASGGEQVYTTSSATVTFSGSEQSEVQNGTTVYDGGILMVMINGYAREIQYGQSSTPASLAAYLASIVGCSTGSPSYPGATATVSGATVTLTACPGTGGMTVSADNDGGNSNFTQPSFQAVAGTATQQEGSVTFSAAAGGTQSGGFNLVFNPSGAPSYTVNLPYTSCSTSASLASSLVAMLGSCSAGSRFSGTQSGAAVSVTACQPGAYSLSVNNGCSNGCSSGGGPLFTAAAASPGSPVGTYDTGTITLTVNGTQIASTAYGPGSTAASVDSALVNAAGNNGIVNLQLTSSGSTPEIAMTAIDTGTPSDYPYSVTVDDTAGFSSPSFFGGGTSGTLQGGTNVPLYSWAVTSYAPDGDMLAMTDSVQGAWSYTYDDMDRVLTADATAGPDSGMDLTWAYDRYGNRWSQTATGTGAGGATQPSLTFNGNTNRIDSYSYDAAGNLLFDGLNYYTYDGANRVLSVNSQSTGYVYDAEGDRVAKLSAGGAVQTVYVLTSGNQQLTELNGSGGWNHTNVYAPGGRLLATYDSSTQPSPGYHDNLTDWLGTKRMQTTAGGNQQETCTSNPYGDGLSCTGGADATEQHFTGKDHDTESSLDYFGARYYSETLGRFMTPDILNLTDERVLKPGSTLNKYVYAADNPLKNVDPDGKDVTVFYESPGFGSPGGHIMFMAENTQTGDAAAMSFGPVRNFAGAGSTTVADMPMMSTTSLGFDDLSLNDLRQNYASLTIQTSPEEAQQIIDFIRNFSTSGNPYILTQQNCTTVCVEALKIIQKLAATNKNWTPMGLWNTLFAKYANSWWQNGAGWSFSTPGVEYGYQEEGWSPYYLMWLLATEQNAADNSSVTTTQGPGVVCGGNTGNPCP